MKDLTERELGVLELIKQGYENHEIAEHIHVSIHTVKVHISSIILKMNARNRTHLVYMAFKQGLIN